MICPKMYPKMEATQGMMCPMMMQCNPMAHGMMPILVDLDDDEDDRDPIALEVNEIFNKIKKNNPEVFSTLRGYGIPPMAAVKLVRRIIRLALMYKK